MTKKELVECWARPPERQYNIALSKIVEAIIKTKGDIILNYSGGKDSSLLVDMYCDVLSNMFLSTSGLSNIVHIMFADTTNETKSMYQYIDEYIRSLKIRYPSLDIRFECRRPERTWVQVIREVGVPLISKQTAKSLRVIRADLTRLGLSGCDIIHFHSADLRNVSALFSMGFSKSSVLYLTGYVSANGNFTKKFFLPHKWFPMLDCPVPLSEKCCYYIKEKTLNSGDTGNHMTGEQAAESANRERVYLQTGCNTTIKGKFVSKPFGPMTQQGILYAIYNRNIPLCSDYGECLLDETGKYYLTGCTRTGCALCGFGCQFDPDRFIRLQEKEATKIKLAFKPVLEGGLGYLEAVTWMNEYCKTKIKIPEVKG